MMSKLGAFIAEHPDMFRYINNVGATFVLVKDQYVLLVDHESVSNIVLSHEHIKVHNFKTGSVRQLQYTQPVHVQVYEKVQLKS